MRSVLGIDLSIYDRSTPGLQKKKASEYNTLDYSSNVFDRSWAKNGSKLVWCGYIPARCWGWNDLCRESQRQVDYWWCGGAKET